MRLRHLQVLRLENATKIRGYSRVGKLADLKVFTAINARPMPDVQFVAGLGKLESVVVRKTAIEDNDLTPLL